MGDPSALLSALDRTGAGAAKGKLRHRAGRPALRHHLSCSHRALGCYRSRLGLVARALATNWVKPGLVVADYHITIIIHPNASADANVEAYLAITV